MRVLTKRLLAAYLLAFVIFVCNALYSAIADEPTSKYVRQLPGADTVIVFVHGIMGDGVSTWTNSGTNAYWPTMLTHDPTFDGVDIFVYSYDAGLFASLSIDEIAEGMRSVLTAGGVSNYQKIVFLSHSMGGLVTRAYLLKNRGVAARTLFAYFFSTPTTGSQLASIASYFVSTPQLNKLKTLTDDAYLADLLRQWLAADFKFPSYCAYEKRATKGIALVVRMDSAVSLCTKAVDPIDADHIDIVKPSSQNSASYIAFKAAYAEATIPGLKTELDEREKRHKVRVALGAFLEEGRTLMVQCANESVPPPEQEADAWARKVEAFFHTEMDDSYIARFRDGSGLPLTATSIQSAPHSRLWSGIWVRTSRLQEFIKEQVN